MSQTPTPRTNPIAASFTNSDMETALRRQFSCTATIMVCLIFILGTVRDSQATPVAHYALDESSGVVVDAAFEGGLNHGTVINDPEVNQNSGTAIFGTSYDLAPTGSAGGGANLGTDVSVRPANDFTMTFWFRPDSFDNFDRIIESMNGAAPTSRGYRFDTGGTGSNLRALLRDGSGTSNSLQHPLTLNPNNWYFGAVRFDKDGDLQVTVIDNSTSTFVDSTVVSGGTASQAAVIGNVLYGAGVPTVLGVASSSGPAVNAFDGHLDDIGFHNKVLSNEELTFVYNTGVGSPIPTLDGLRLNFQADSDVGANNTWSMTTDPTGLGNFNWTLTGNPSPVTADEIVTRGIKQAYEAPGTASTYSAAGLAAQTQDATFETWFNADNLVGKHVLFETGGDVSGASIVIDGNQLTYTAQTSSTDRMQVSTTLSSASVGHANQVVGTIDFLGGGAAQINLYMNGMLIGSDTLASGFTSFAGGDGAGLGRVGGNSVAGTPNANVGDFTNFDGQIAINRFYQNKVLSSAEVAANFTEVYGVQPYVVIDDLLLNFNAADAGTLNNTQFQPNVENASGTQFHWNLPSGQAPTLLSGTSSAFTGIETAYDFDGTQKGNSNTNLLNVMDSSQNASFELWVKPDDLLGNDVLLEMGGSGDGTIFAMEGDTLHFVSQTGPSNRLETSTILTPGMLSDFIQIVGTIDLTNDEIALYVNGLLAGSDVLTSGDHSIWSGNSGAGLGGVNGTTPLDAMGLNNFNGEIAILRFYEGSVLSLQDVRSNYFGVTGILIPEPPTGMLILLGGLFAAVCGRRWLRVSDQGA